VRPGAVEKLLASTEGVVEHAELADEMRERTLSFREDGVIILSSSSVRTEAPSVVSPPPPPRSGFDELELPDTVLAIESFFLHQINTPFHWPGRGL
jgi:hypothetical protein